MRDRLDDLKVTKVEFAFDERDFPRDVGVPIRSKHGVILMKFNDGTAVSKACIRRDFEATLAFCFNQKLEALQSYIDTKVIEGRIENVYSILEKAHLLDSNIIRLTEDPVYLLLVDLRQQLVAELKLKGERNEFYILL